MMQTSRPVVFFGTEDFSLASLEALHEKGFPIALVVTKPDTKRGRKQVLTPPSVKVFAEQHGIRVLQPSNIRDVLPEIEALDDPVGVLVSFGKIIPEVLLHAFPEGITNLHPSLLPRYRGPSPIESAIQNGDATTGISIMRLEKAMDAGPIYVQTEYELTGDETQPSLYDDLAQRGAHLLAETLPLIINKALDPVPQDDTRATYCALLSKADAPLDPTTHRADELARKVRAHISYPKTTLTLPSGNIIITKAHEGIATDDMLSVTCLGSTYLIIDELIAPSGKTMTAQAYLRGYHV